MNKKYLVAGFLLSALLLFMGLPLIGSPVPSDYYAILERFATFEFMHLLYGVCAGCFISAFTSSRLIVLGGVFIGAVVWEIYEHLWMLAPSDTLLDLVLGILGGYIILQEKAKQ